jgi:ketosteroid isomerase-like protein
MRLTSLYLEAINYTSHKPQLDSLSKQLGKTPQEIITWIEPITDAARYVEWILKQLKTNTIKLPEDADRVKQLLIDFNHYKSIGAADINKDIGSYKTIYDLEVVIDKLKGIDLKGRAETRQEYRAGTQWVNESPNYKILEITTPEAAAHYGLNTKWCTSDAETAKKYLIEGPLYIIFQKQPDGKLEKLYQYTYDYSQFMNILDKPVKPNKEIRQLIKPPLNSKPESLAGFCVLIGSRWLEAEPAIAQNPRWAYYYALDVLKRPWPEAEPYIVKDPIWAYFYALYVLKRPWPEAEPTIAKNPQWAHYYARYTLRRPWPEAEPAIAQNPRWAYYYALDVLKRPWPEAELCIAKDTFWAYCYAVDVLKERFLEAEPTIAKSLEYWVIYARHFHIKG